MTRSAGIAGGIAAAAVSAALFGPSPAAAAPQHDPPQATIDTAERTVEVRMIEVPVPTHDRATETVQMGVAAALGAILAARATAVRVRRRLPPRAGLIDITEVVQSGGTERTLEDAEVGGRLGVAARFPGGARKRGHDVADGAIR